MPSRAEGGNPCCGHPPGLCAGCQNMGPTFRVFLFATASGAAQRRLCGIFARCLRRQKALRTSGTCGFCLLALEQKSSQIRRCSTPDAVACAKRTPAECSLEAGAKEGLQMCRATSPQVSAFHQWCGFRNRPASKIAPQIPMRI